MKYDLIFKAISYFSKNNVILKARINGEEQIGKLKLEKNLIEVIL